MVKVYEVTKEEFLNKFFDLLSVIQSDANKFSKAQKQTLIEFLMLPEERYVYTRFHAAGKKAVTKILKEKYDREISEANMTQFITRMREMGVIVVDEDGVKYLSKPIKNYLNKALKSDEPIEIKFRFSIKDGNNRQDRDTGEAVHNEA